MAAGKKRYDMLTDHPGKALLFFAIPMIFGNLFQQLYNITDSVVVGQFVGGQALAAVGASYAITNVFIAIAIGGGNGSAVVVSQFLGAGKIAKMKTAVFTTLINFLVIGICLGVFGIVFHETILRLVNTPEDIFADAALYLAIYFVGLPFLFMYNVQASIFNSLGDSKTPLRLLIFSSLLNIVLDLVFVINFGLAVRGVAVATLVAQGISAVLSFMILMRKLKGYQEEQKYRYYDRDMMVPMVRIAIPSTVQQPLAQMGILLVQSVVNSFGSAVLAGYSAGTRIESISIVPMLAMGNAMATFAAQNIGAGKLERIREGYKMCYITVLSVGAALCVLYQLFGGVFVSLFLEDGSGEAYAVGLEYVHFLAFFYSFIGLKSTTDGLLRGAGDVAAFTIANLVNLSIRVIVTNVFAPIYGIQVAWMAVPLGWAANYLISFSWYLTGKWKKVRVIDR